MTGGRIHNLIHFLRSTAGPVDAVAGSDGALLQRYASARDETAFAQVAGRHAAMVLGVCRRVLGDAHEAEDAFQATFLILARKAQAAARYRSVGGWLHTVAFRVALRAKNRRAARQVRPAPLPEVAWAGPDPAVEAAGREVRKAIDQEVGRLPERYRVPFVLHYFEGRNAAEVARELGHPVGTVESWLARARERLRAALARRKLALAPALLAGLAVVDGPGLARAADWTRRALASAHGASKGASDGAVSAQAEALATAVLRTLPSGRGKILAAVAALIALLGVAAGVAAAVLTPDDPVPDHASLAPAGPRPEFLPPQRAVPRQPVARGILTGHSKPIAALALSGDGRILASADGESHIKWWDLSTLQQQPVLTQTLKKPRNHLGDGYQQDSPRALLLRADGKTLLSGGRDAWIRVWDLDRRVDVSAFTRHSVGVLALATSTDGTRMLSVAADYNPPDLQKAVIDPPCLLELKLWDLTKHEEIAGFHKLYRRTRFLCAAISPDLRTVVLAGRDGKVLVWDAVAGDEVASLTAGPAGMDVAVRAVALNPDGATLAASVSCHDRQTRQSWDQVTVWDLGTLRPRFSLKRSSVAALAFSPDGKVLALGGKDSDPLTGRKWGEIWLRDAANGEPHSAPLMVPRESVEVCALAFNERGDVLVTGDTEGQLIVWDLAR